VPTVRKVWCEVTGQPLREAARSVTGGGFGSPASSCLALQPLQHQRQPEGDKVEHARTVTLRHLVDETAARMRAREERPRGGVRQGAITAVADSIGLETVLALFSDNKSPKW
jgi:hypothetical protein